jgi:hypothetical protein
MRDDIPGRDLRTAFTHPPPEAASGGNAGTSGPSATPSLAFIRWAVAEHRAPDAGRISDRFIVTSAPGGALVGVVDGLGNGPEADQAAESTAATLESHAGQPLWWLLQRCHVELRERHEATMALTEVSRSGTLKWGGIADIGGTLVRSAVSTRHPEAAFRLAGSARFILPRVQLATTTLTRGDLVILATRGIVPGFARHVSLHDDPGTIARRVLYRQRWGDEALVLVVRFVGT